jgi:hypothetical protein
MLATTIDPEKAVAHAMSRHKKIVERGVFSYTTRDEDDIVRQSALAELFACQYFKAEYRNIDTTAGDGGYDFVLKSGRTVDVKWLGYNAGTKTPRCEGRVMVREILGLHADIYVCVAGCEEKGFYIAGWCTKEELQASERFIGVMGQDGCNSNYAVRTRNLHPVRK